jgi:hypothetical protein
VIHILTLNDTYLTTRLLNIKVSAQAKFHVEENDFIYYLKKAYGLNFSNIKSILRPGFCFFCGCVLPFSRARECRCC